jgi:hypothetical protein
MLSKRSSAHESLLQATPQMQTQHHQTYRDAPINGQPIHLHPAHTQAHTQPVTNAQEVKLQNQLNIKTCQLLIKLQMSDANPLKLDQPRIPNALGKYKIAANTWLINSNNVNPPPPPKSAIQAITPYHDNRILIKTTTQETAAWIRQYPDLILQPIFGHPIKILNRLYLVIARFTPVLFNTDNKSICELEKSANVTENSISHTTWIKSPNCRSKGQQYANLKIHCKTAKMVNKLILESGCINILGSIPHIHKNIKAPRTYAATANNMATLTQTAKLQFPNGATLCL